ncbi:AAA family ATPase [Akkermansiaceae bacterium]|nr:AAA family ATPase [Akkermansiaceae bacterium]
MPVTKVIIENFKGIRDQVEIPIRPITLLFGANSAGKSTILQALLFLRELLERQNADADRLLASGASVDLGGFEQFVYGHDLSRKIRIGVEMELDSDGLPQYGNQADTVWALSEITKISVDVLVEWSHSEQRPYITHYQVGMDGEPFGAIRAEPGFEGKLNLLNHQHHLLKEDEDENEPGGLNQVSNNFFDFNASNSNDLLSDAPLLSDSPVGQADIIERGFSQAINIGERVIPDFGRILPDEWQSPPTTQEMVEEYNDALAILSRIFCGAGELALNELQNIRYVGPTRVFPSRGYQSQRSPGNSRWADGSAAWDLLYSAKGGSDWFDPNSLNNLGLGYSFKLKDVLEIPTESHLGSILKSGGDITGRLLDLDPDLITRDANNLVERSQLKLVCERTGVEVDPSDVGSGVSQVVPVLVGAKAPGYSILSVEQPELHIHPAVQCTLADALAEEVLQSDDRCLLLETHSEHLMLRWLRRIRELHEEELPPDAPTIRPEQLSVLHVESGDQGQKITRLPITEDGDFAVKWPQGFFEERAEELFS